MRSRPTNLVPIVAALFACLAMAGPAAADTQRVSLGKGALTAPKATWVAIAVPRGSILIDLLDTSGRKIQTYGKQTSSMRPRAIEASGFRPRALPTRHALLAGATGAQVHKIRVHVKGGLNRTVRTVPSPRDWGVANRLFALGFTVPARHRAAMRVVTKIEGLNARGKVITTQRTIPTGAY